MKIGWRRAPNAGTQGWVSQDGVWKIRGPLMGKPIFWLYRNGSRYTTTGRYEDAVHFASAAAAKTFVDNLGVL